MSAFTPDSQLDLLFSADIIPKDVRDALSDDLHIRPLASSDHSRSHLEVLSVLSPSPLPSVLAYTAQFNAIRSPTPTHFVIVIIDKNTDKVVGTGTLFLERKFIRGLGCVGHIEDIAVDKKVQGKKLGLRVVNALTGISEQMGCYKTILNCSKDNIPFYEKCGFQLKENEMARYTPKVAPQPQKL